MLDSSFQSSGFLNPDHKYICLVLPSRIPGDVSFFSNDTHVQVLSAGLLSGGCREIAISISCGNGVDPSSYFQGQY